MVAIVEITGGETMAVDEKTSSLMNMEETTKADTT